MAHNTSLIPLTAREIHRLALSALADMEATRGKIVTQALEAVKQQRCTHFFGLVSHQKYPTRELAMEHSPVVLAAKQWASSDFQTCEILKRAAQYFIDTAREDQIIQVSLNDYRALT